METTPPDRESLFWGDNQLPINYFFSKKNAPHVGIHKALIFQCLKFSFVHRQNHLKSFQQGGLVSLRDWLENTESLYWGLQNDVSLQMTSVAWGMA